LLKELPTTARQQRLLCTHGPFDTLIPIAGVREQIKDAQGCRPGRRVARVSQGAYDSRRGRISVIREFVRAGHAVVANNRRAATGRADARAWEAHTFTSRFAPGIQICSERGWPAAASPSRC